MLVVHPSSTCDVCLDSFPGDEIRAPYSIPCGHIFCFSCLSSLRERICPLCRQDFRLNNLRKLHVDMSNVSTQSQIPSPPTREELQLRELEQRIKKACREDISEDEFQYLADEILKRPIESSRAETHHDNFKPLEEVVILLSRYRKIHNIWTGAQKQFGTMRRGFQDMQRGLDTMTHEYQKAKYMNDELRMASEDVPKSYLSRIVEPLIESSKKIDSLEAENLRLNNRLQDRATGPNRNSSSLSTSSQPQNQEVTLGRIEETWMELTSRDIRGSQIQAHDQHSTNSSPQPAPQSTGTRARVRSRSGPTSQQVSSVPNTGSSPTVRQVWRPETSIMVFNLLVLATLAAQITFRNSPNV